MGLPGMALSAVATVAGAILYWAITYQGTGFRLSTVGLILMIAGVIGFIISATIFGISRKSPGAAHHTMDRQVVNPQGQASSVHEETNG
jgi:phosphate/sulfate permease